MTVPVGALVAIAVVGIIVAGLLSACEAAVMRVSRAAVAEETEQNPRRARYLASFTADPQSTAASAAFGRILAEMTATACITLSLEALLDVWWQVLGLAILASTLVALLLVRLSPRTIGRNHPIGVLVVLSGLLSATRLAVGWAERLTGRKAMSDEDGEHELREMVERVSESEVIEDEDRELFRSVFELGDTLTREVMVPRTDMVTISHTKNLEQALDLFLRSGFSRIPVIGESEDDLRGIIYLKDTIAFLHTDSQHERASRAVHQFMRPAHFVPESKPVDDLLRELQLASSHMAIAVDEYGGIAGLVTMEDTLEEIIGEVTDEHDRVVVETTDLGGGVFRVPARFGLDELGELLGIEVEDDEVDTAAGLLAKAMGKVPLLGAEADIYGVHLSAERIEGRRKRLATLLVRRSDTSAGSASTAGGTGTARTLQDETALELSQSSRARPDAHRQPNARSQPNAHSQRRTDRKSES